MISNGSPHASSRVTDISSLSTPPRDGSGGGATSPRAQNRRGHHHRHSVSSFTRWTFRDLSFENFSPFSLCRTTTSHASFNFPSTVRMASSHVSTPLVLSPPSQVPFLSTSTSHRFRSNVTRSDSVDSRSGGRESLSDRARVSRRL